MKLGTKLVTAFLGCGLIPLGIVAYVSYSTASHGMEDVTEFGREALEKTAYNQLIALRDVKKAQIEKYFAEREGDMGVLVENVKSLRHEAFANLSSVQMAKKTEVQKFFEEVRKDLHSLRKNPALRAAFDDFQAYQTETQVGADEPCDVSTDGYRQVWEKHDPYLGEYMRTHGYYDIFLIHGDHGQVLYTAAKEADLGSNLGHGPYKDSGLANLWRHVRDTQAISFEDFEPYAPSAGAQAAFVGVPLKNASGELYGVLALQIPTDPINNIVQRREGLGTTGETYLVGIDEGLTAFRSDMLTMGNGKYVIGAEIHTEYIDRVLETGRGFQETYVDSTGNPVLVIADPLEIDGLNWACITKMDFEEVIAIKLKGEQEDFLAKYNNMYGYYDLFLINSVGYCFYSVCHEADYQTNFVEGRFKDSNLGGLVRQVLSTGKFGFADFAPYAPSDNEPCAFIAAPVTVEGNTEMLVALQLPLDHINSIMGIRAGMGETGETYLVGPDKLMRSDSFLDPANHTVSASFKNPSKGKVDTEAAREALAGKSDAKIITDYNGNPVLSAYTPVNVFGKRWGLLAEIDESEALAAVSQMNDTSSAASAMLLTWVSSLGAVAAIAVTLISLFIARSISKPINRIIEKLTEGANQVTEAAGQVSSTSQSLAEGASEQASSLEETSSALEEMAAMTRTNAENAKEANGLSDQARDAAQSGDQTMHRLNDAMTGINESSDKISKIIKVIEEIAFQTNLLALNAAVEAARAGEHGKGFAVVAEEVRNLAMRAADAARETTGLIEESVGRARDGSQVASDVGSALSGIVQHVTRVSELINGITRASEEQAQGVEQVNTAVSQMDKVTQQNAAGAEESASASEELSAQAIAVNNVVRELAAIVGSTTENMQQTRSATAAHAASGHFNRPSKKQKRQPAQQSQQDWSQLDPSSESGDASANNDKDLGSF